MGGSAIPMLLGSSVGPRWTLLPAGSTFSAHAWWMVAVCLYFPALGPWIVSPLIYAVSPGHNLAQPFGLLSWWLSQACIGDSGACFVRILYVIHHGYRAGPAPWVGNPRTKCSVLSASARPACLAVRGMLLPQVFTCLEQPGVIIYGSLPF